jgi:hypothetical protein
MKHRTEGHTETTISGDTRADGSGAFELVPSLQVERAFKPMQAIMFAKVLSIEIRGPKDEPIASIAGSSLPPPAAPK